MIIKAIVAMTSKNGIGIDGHIPNWRMKDDMKFFREQTKGTVVIMGRKTFEETGVLPGRMNIVITSESNLSNFCKGDRQLYFAHGPEHALSLAKAYGSTNAPIYIIGGASIYKAFADKIDTWYVTTVHCDLPCDTYFDESLLKDFLGYRMDWIPINTRNQFTGEIMVYHRDE